MRVACSTLFMRTVSASASACSASARALRTVDRSVSNAVSSAAKPPPRTTLSTSLQLIPLAYSHSAAALYTAPQASSFFGMQMK